MNILIPLAGKTSFRDTIVPLVPINYKTVIEYVLDNLNFGGNEKFIFVVNESDCTKYFFDEVLKMVKPDSVIVKVKNRTGGQLCSCLLAIEHIDTDEPLLIVNGDQYLAEDVRSIIDGFKKKGADGGIVTFTSVHPKWSFVLLEEGTDIVIETSEKRPISNHACVGMYYFAKGNAFVDAAKKVIRKGNTVNDSYYVSSAYNELILMNKVIRAHTIDSANFFSFDSEEAVNYFITSMRKS